MVLLILLAIFTVIDFIWNAKSFTKKQAQYTSVAVGVIAIVFVGTWGIFTGSDAGKTSIWQSSVIPSAESTVDEAYELGQFYFKRGDYEEAIKSLREVPDNSSNYVDAQRLLADAADQYRTGLLDIANEYKEKNDYVVAIDILTAGLAVIPEDKELLQTIDDYSLAHTSFIRINAIADVETYVSEQDYANAIRAIWNAKDEIGDDAELDALQEKYLEEYKKFALVQADKLFNSEGYEAAVRYLQEVQSLPLLDSELSKAVEGYQSYQPISVAELEIWREDPISGKCGPNNGTIVDNYGNSYSPYFDDDGSNIYKVDREYSTLTGVFCVKKEENSSFWITYLYIWKITNGERDGLLYDSQLTGGNEPVEFTINVSDVDFIEICLSTGYHGANAFVANLFLTK